MTATPTNPYIWSTTASAALCIAAPIAVYAASQRSLKKYACILQENDTHGSADTRKQADTSASEPVPEVEPVVQSRRSRWAKGLKFGALFVAIMSVGFGLGFGLPFITTPKVLDICWLVFMTRQIYVIIRSAINTALPDPRVMEVHWTAWNSITWTVTGPNPKSPSPTTNPRMIAAMSLAVLCISGVYSGRTWLMCIPASAFIYDQVSCLGFPDRKLKNMVKWVVYLQSGIVAAVLVGIGISSLYTRYISSKTDADQSKPSKFSQPSPEVLALMTMYQKCSPLIVPAFFVALGLRFDYAQAKKTMGNQISSGAAISSHSISIPAFPRPIFKAGLKVYFIQLVALLLVYGSSISPSVKNALSFGEMMCITVWPIIARQVIVARNLGVFEDFMNYSEVRVKKALPEGEEAEEKEKEQADAVDIEKSAETQDVKT